MQLKKLCNLVTPNTYLASISWYQQVQSIYQRRPKDFNPHLWLIFWIKLICFSSFNNIFSHVFCFPFGYIKKKKWDFLPGLSTSCLAWLATHRLQAQSVSSTKKMLAIVSGLKYLSPKIFFNLSYQISTHSSTIN